MYTERCTQTILILISERLAEAKEDFNLAAERNTRIKKKEKK